MRRGEGGCDEVFDQDTWFRSSMHLDGCLMTFWDGMHWQLLAGWEKSQVSWKKGRGGLEERRMRRWRGCEVLSVSLEGEIGPELQVGKSPWGALVFKTIQRRLIVSRDRYFHFLSKPSIATEFTFTSCVVIMNSSQLKDACDQGLMVETCCAKEKNKILSLFVFLKRGQRK